MERIKEQMRSVKVPQRGDKIYKDECIFSYDNPESETGLYVCMNTFLGFGKDYVSTYSEKTGNKIFLHIKHNKKEIIPEKGDGPEKKIARLAIGIEGGFNPDVGKKYSIEEHHSIVLLPDFESFLLPNEDMPLLVQESVDKIIKGDSALHIAEVEAAAQGWDGEIRQESKHAAVLKQLDNGVKIPPSGWKCSRCEKTDNLWLNLTDGTILCGRRQLDGSGGNNHAADYYKETGYPLAVKLGTVTSEGKADVFSYDEDDMVLDSNLTAHLSHFGINVNQMQKTEKTMLELEIEYNQHAWEYSRITESGSQLTPKFGPGFTGMRNLGNSCYLNSVMQTLMSVPSFVNVYYNKADDIFSSTPFKDVPEDFNVQMAKLSKGLWSGKYSKSVDCSSDQPEDIDNLQPGISPTMFRTLVGRGHSEFSTKKQQDAMEFLEHVLKLVQRNLRGLDDAGHCFKFEVEDKFICSESNKVRYVTREDLYLPLPVPLEAASNKEEVSKYLAKKAEGSNIPFKPEEQVHSKVSFEACLSKLISSEEISAFSSAVDREVPMNKITKLKSFPDYLLIQLVKFGMSPDWQPVKYDVSVDMPDVLDLSALKGFGIQPGEELMPDVSPKSTTAACVPDENIVQQIAEMGFPIEACKKAVFFTNNSGSEAALNWVMEHMDDLDFAVPMETNKQENKDFVPNAMGLEMITAMGFTNDQASLALKETNNDVERAADWIFSHQPQLDSLVAAELGKASSSQTEKKAFTDGSPKYELIAFISHMGSSIFVGHYICHIKKDGEWAIFNDNKVCKSEDPPKDLAYIYLYKRISNSE